MSIIDIDYFRTWIGKTRSNEDIISLRHARLMAATVGYPVDEISDGANLPPLWHWTYFLEGVPANELGEDGHPSRGGFMPPIPLPNRMWAGGRVKFISPVIIGTVVHKKSTIIKVDHKQGRSGDLVFVTVQHELKSAGGNLLVSEEQDLVYKGAAIPSKSDNTLLTEQAEQFGKSYTPTSTMLFRYSALTFNGHRIHYDVDYCRNSEGYNNLVIHGPLNATIIAGYAEEFSGKKLREFNYRGLAPALLGETIHLKTNILDGRLLISAVLNNGVECMQGDADFAG